MIRCLWTLVIVLSGTSAFVAETVDATQGTKPPQTRTSPPAPAPRSAPPPGRPAPASRPAAKPVTVLGDRVFLAGGGLFQPSRSAFDAGYTFSESLETGAVTSKYAVRSGPGFDGRVTIRAWRRLTAGAGVTAFTDRSTAAVSASIPHPFFFNRARAVEGSAEVGRRETAVHLTAGWVAPIGRRVVLAVDGGPVFFSVEQDVVGEVQWEDSYPYDAAQFTRAQTTRLSQSTVGFGVGADVSYYFTRGIGVGGYARFAKASVSMEAPGGSLDVEAGGPQVGFGLRVRIPAGLAARKPVPPPSPKQETGPPPPPKR
jgi:hypothetical protein